MKRRSARSYLGSGTKYLVLFLFAVWTVVPIFIVVTNSFKTEMDIFTVPFKLVFAPTLGNYQRAFAMGEFGQYFLNSMLVAFCSSFLSVCLGVLAAYGFTNIREKHAKVLNVILIVGKSVPAITVLLPLFVILSRVHLLGTYVGPIITHTSINLPFVIWLIIGFINDIPSDLATAAEIDGCSKMQALWFIIRAHPHPGHQLGGHPVPSILVERVHVLPDAHQHQHIHPPCGHCEVRGIHFRGLGKEQRRGDRDDGAYHHRWVLCPEVPRARNDPGRSEGMKKRSKTVKSTNIVFPRAKEVVVREEDVGEPAGGKC